MAIVKIVTPCVVSGCTAEAARWRLTSVVPGHRVFRLPIPFARLDFRDSLLNLRDPGGIDAPQLLDSDALVEIPQHAFLAGP